MDIDTRGPRFGAAVTTVVLAAVLITGSTWLLAWQVLAFALGASGGVAHSAYGWLFRKVVRPRLGPPAQLEFAAASAVRAGRRARVRRGGADRFHGDRLAGVRRDRLRAGGRVPQRGVGYCQGCEMYLLVRRMTVRAQ